MLLNGHIVIQHTLVLLFLKEKAGKWYKMRCCRAAANHKHEQIAFKPQTNCECRGAGICINWHSTRFFPWRGKKIPGTVSLLVSQFLLTRNNSQLRIIYEYGSPCCVFAVTTFRNTSIQTLLSLHFAHWCRYFNVHFRFLGTLAWNTPFVNFTLSFRQLRHSKASN